MVAYSRSTNRKVMNATRVEYGGTMFKSKLELSCYKRLVESGLNPEHESERVVLWEGCKLSNTGAYAPVQLRRGVYGATLEPQTRALPKTTYTPDFVITKGKYKIYFDVKGKENDAYPIKKKMFLKHLEERNDGWVYLFFEPHNMAHVAQAINFIKEL